MLAASVFAFAGIVLAAIAVLVIGRRSSTLTAARAGVIAAIVVVVAIGTLALRSYDITNFFSFLGVKPTATSTAEDVQTGSQRAMLAYIGLRIWEDHPLGGVGVERPFDRYHPYPAPATPKFPDHPAQAYPTHAHPRAVHNLRVQL